MRELSLVCLYLKPLKLKNGIRFDNRLKRLKIKMKRVNCEKDEFEEKVKRMTCEYECKALESQLQDMQKEETQLLQMAKKAKESVLLKKFQNGPDIIKAMEWLKNNHDQFAGHVYDPLMISIDVQNAAQNAKYLEYVIPTRDLQAFAAENAEDANFLMKQFSKITI